MEDYSKNKISKLKQIEQEIQERDCTFKPNLNKSAKSIEQLRRLEGKRKKSKNIWSKKSIQYESDEEQDDCIETFGKKSKNKISRSQLLKKYLQSEVASKSPKKSFKGHLRKVSQKQRSTKQNYKRAKDIFDPMLTNNTHLISNNSSLYSSKKIKQKKRPSQLRRKNSYTNVSSSFKQTKQHKKNKNLPEEKSFKTKKKM